MPLPLGPSPTSSRSELVSRFSPRSPCALPTQSHHTRERTRFVSIRASVILLSSSFILFSFILFSCFNSHEVRRGFAPSEAYREDLSVTPLLLFSTFVSGFPSTLSRSLPVPGESRCSCSSPPLPAGSSPPSASSWQCPRSYEWSIMPFPKRRKYPCFVE